MRQFVLFSMVGTAGFVVDSVVLELAIRFLGSGLYVGRAISFLCAATFTWSMNRLFTFPGARKARGAGQWMRFVSVNLVGALFNLGVYYWLVTSYAQIAARPVLAVAAGSLAGLFFNFTLSRALVFRVSSPP